jgi:GlpG protein
MNRLELLRYTPLTLVLITICVIVAMASSLGRNQQMLYPFYMSLPHVMQGEVWRLITPIFIHFGAIHILFNTLWLYDLGSAIELRQKSHRLGLLVGIIGISSNIGQYFSTGFNFGGMSGVVYGLLGYFWVQGKLNPQFGLELHKQIVYMMMIWFVLCWTGLVGEIANVAHTVGLLSGLLLGWIFSPNKKPGF